MKLANKVALITGGAAGMGKEISLLFAKEGASVVVSDLNLEGAQQVADEIKQSGGKAIAVQANVAVESDVEAMMQKTLEEFGTLDILINNAGIMDNFTAAANVTDELWNRIFSVNVDGVMRSTRRALNIFLEKGGGTIVNMSSAAGVNGSRAGAAYTASKHAIIGYTKNVGFQYAIKGIRCNAIAPGGVNTDINTSMEPDEFGMERAMLGTKTNPRSGEPVEVARVALFLASDDSSFVNGEVIRTDAGWMAY